MMKMMACWNLENKSLRNELAGYHHNNMQLEDEIYPTNIPISMILAKSSVEQVSKGTSGLDWEKMYMDLIAGNKKGKIIILAGDHASIHWNNSIRIAAIIKETIQRKYTAQGQ